MHDIFNRLINFLVILNSATINNYSENQKMATSNKTDHDQQ